MIQGGSCGKQQLWALCGPWKRPLSGGSTARLANGEDGLFAAVRNVCYPRDKQDEREGADRGPTGADRGALNPAPAVTTSSTRLPGIRAGWFVAFGDRATIFGPCE